MVQDDRLRTTIQIASLTAGGNWLGDTLLYPVDTISTRLKANKYISHNPFTFAIASLKKQGLKLFKGVQLTFPAAFVPTFFYVMIYDQGLKKISTFVDKNFEDKRWKLIFPFFVSSFAQFLCLFPYLPVDTIRTRIQMNRPEHQYRSFYAALREVKAKEGISRFYKSARIYFISKTLGTAIQFQSFETIRYFVGPSVSWMFFNALASTAIATTLLNPLEVLITRYALVDTTKKQLVFRNIVKRIYKREGLKGFYKGYATQLVYHCTYAMFWLPLYQIIRQSYGIQLLE